MSTRREPRALGDAVRRLRDQVQPQTPLAELQAVWDTAVGETVARHARPVAERDGLVTVACTAATWAQELDLLRDDLVAGLRERLGDDAPTRFRFVVGEGRYSDPL